MGWFGGLFGGDGASAPGASDPLASLDPKVAAFLKKESPLKYQTAAEVDVTRNAAEQEKKARDAQTQQQQQQQQRRPPPSLYEDGRYADLWKTYQPLSEIEAATKSDHERLMDVLEAFKDRRARIGRAALENCALEQSEWNSCIKNGPLRKRMTMCQEEMGEFERCYNTQSRLLKALGYLSTYERKVDVDERIQMHADTLYQRMREQEAALAKAKAEGRPLPTVDMSGTMTAAVSAPPDTPAYVPAQELPPEVRKEWDEALAKVPAAERAAAEAAMHADRQARTELATRVTALREAQAAERAQRKAEGKATIVDRVTGLFSVR